MTPDSTEKPLAAPVGPNARAGDDDCYRCWDERTKDAGIMERMTSRRMFLCPSCGNKRCPKASDHRLRCTGSNASGQAGSIYA